MRVAEPEAVRFIHTGDWQLGMRRYYLDEAAQADFAEARLAAVERIVRLAAEEECDFVVVCGDVFESNQIESKTRLRALEAMRGTVAVYLLPGNHDPLDATAIYTSRLFADHRPENVHLLSGRVEINSWLELVGVPWTSKRPTSDPVAAGFAEPLAPGKLRVVAGHGQPDRGHPKPEKVDLIRLDRVEEALAEGRLHYLALGDRHSLGAVGSSGRVWYAGTPEATDFIEERPGYVLRVDLSPESIEIEERRIGRWRFVAKSAEMMGIESIEELASWFAALEDKRATVVRLALGGQLTLRDSARLEEILARQGDLLAGLDRAVGAGWTVLPDGVDRDRLGLEGFAREALEELQRLARQEGGRAVAARDALGLLFRLVEEGRSVEDKHSVGGGLEPDGEAGA